MYTEFYGLSGAPFQLTPDHRFYFGSSVHKKALGYLVYGLHQGEGFIVITGEVGSGKTTLLGYLMSTLEETRFVTAKVVTTQLGPTALLRMVARAFGIPETATDKARLLGKIEAFLISNQKSGRRCLLFVDEAQNLSVDALEELRMLSNFQYEQRALLQSFLLGQPQFRRTIASSELDQLRQRVLATCHLGPMNAEETGGYVEHRLRTVDWNNDPEISQEAMQEIHKHTGGLPRKINLLCSRLLVFGFLEEIHRLDGGVVRQVVKDLTEEFVLGGDESESGAGRGVTEATNIRLTANSVAPDTGRAMDNDSSARVGTNDIDDERTSSVRPDGMASLADARVGGANNVMSEINSRLERIEAQVRRHDTELRQAQILSIDYAVDTDDDDSG